MPSPARTSHHQKHRHSRRHRSRRAKRSRQRRSVFAPVVIIFVIIAVGIAAAILGSQKKEKDDEGPIDFELLDRELEAQ